MLTDPDRLGEHQREILDPGSVLLLSAASTWEIAIKAGIGRLELPEPIASYIPSRIQTTRVTPLVIEHGHTLVVSDLPNHHRDPFDRLLIAQAIVERVPILTTDPEIEAYDVATIRVGD